MLGLLRWPNGGDGGLPLPLVQAPPGAACLRLRARTAAEALHRALLEEAVSGGDALARAAQAAEPGEPPLLDADWAGAAALRAGPPRAGRHAALDVLLSRAAGKFPDVCERLVAGHLSAGDSTSAMVTSDWYAGLFPGWAQPRAHACRLLNDLGRFEEGRDAAVAALTGAPLWTMEGELVGPTLAAAGLAGRPVSWLRQQLEARAGGSGAAGHAARMAAGEPTRAERAAQRAAEVMDAVAAGERAGGWAAAAEELAGAYAEAGRRELAALARGVA